MNTLGRVDVFLTALLVGLPSALDTSLASTAGIDEKRPTSGRSVISNTNTRTRRLTRKRRPKPTSSSIKLPPPSTPFFLRIALGLWSILLAFWRSLVGETRAERKRLTRKRANTLRTRLREGSLEVPNASGGHTTDDGSGSGSDGEGVDAVEEELDEVIEANGNLDTPARRTRSKTAKAKSRSLTPAGEEGLKGSTTVLDGWVDPVTRAPPDPEPLDQPADDEFVPPTIPSPSPASSSSSSSSSVSSSSTTSSITFRLRSSSGSSDRSIPSLRSSLESLDTRKLPFMSSTPISPPSILSNPKRQARLLPNPMSTSLLDPSVPVSSTISIPSIVKSHPLSIKPHQTPFHSQKTLILDLDETLIHSTSRPMSYSASAGGGLLGLSFGGLLGGRKSRREGHTVEVVLNGRSTTYHVYKRPYVDHFLKKVANWYTLVIYTASMPEYADPVIDWLDGGRGLFAKRLYRESCFLQRNGSYIKDLSLVEQDLSRVCFMDNSPISYLWNKPNALPIEGWTSDPYDEALLQSIPVLDSLRFVNDVRSVLGIRGF